MPTILPRMYAALLFNKKTPGDKADLGQEVHDNILANPGVFNNVPVEVNNLPAKVTTLRAKIQAALNGGKLEKEELAIAEYNVETLMVDVASYVEGIANNDPVTAKQTIILAGLTPRKTPEKSPVPVPVDVIGAFFTDASGKILVKWKGVKYARTYALFMTLTPNVEESWQIAAVTSKKKWMVENLDDGVRMYFRLISVGVNGQSLPSITVSQITTHF